MVFCRIFIEDIMKFKLMVLVSLIVGNGIYGQYGAGHSEDALLADYIMVDLNNTPAKARLLARVRG